jgi:hypothetical protein
LIFNLYIKNIFLFLIKTILRTRIYHEARVRVFFIYYFKHIFFKISIKRIWPNLFLVLLIWEVNKLYFYCILVFEFEKEERDSSKNNEEKRKWSIDHVPLIKKLKFVFHIVEKSRSKFFLFFSWFYVFN